MIDDDLNAIISELDAAGGGAARTIEGGTSIEALLAEVIARRGSDLLLVAGSPAAVRVDGVIARRDHAGGPRGTQ